VNSEPNSKCCEKARVAITAVVIVATFLIMAGLVKLMIAYTQAPSTAATRAAERAANLKQYKADNTKLHDEYGYVDATKGVVRLPVERAMEITTKEWLNPAAARSNLIARVEKATALPPKAPEVKSPYE
jgi:hypothetical protein